MAADFVVRGDTRLDGSGFSKGLSKLASAAKKGLKIVGASIAGIGTYALKVGSDFEAAMSEVQAISGATGEDLQRLTDAAKEMGATTKFSASESAEALKYMAMAGWDTQKMLNGLPGIISLAAASGEELGTVSDIVTDAMTAFGLSADKAGHFADVLAQASNRSNTNVSMLGDSFRYVAPVAGALGFNIEDTAIALGLMANSGIKASQAGTALRSLLSNLTHPVGQSADAIDELNISIENSDGSMKSLSDIIKDLRKKFSVLTEAEKAQYAAMLAGQEGMSGLLAIINTSDSDFETLSNSIYAADGASKQMADTMQNNLKGSVTNLKSAVEGLGVAFYDSFSDKAKNTVDKVTGHVRELTQAVQTEGINGLIKAGQTVLLELSKSLTGAIPGFINTIKISILGSSNVLINGFLDIAKNIVDAMIAFLPKSLQKPFKSAIDGVYKTLKNGGIDKIVDTLSKAFKNLSKIVEKTAKTVLPAFNKVFSFVIDNFDTLLPLAIGLVGAFKTFKILQSVTGWFSAANKAILASQAATSAEALATAASTGAITLKQAAVGVLTGKIGLATAAQAAWNAVMNASPLGIVATAVTVLTGGLIAICTVFNDTETAEERLAKTNEALGDSFGGVGEAAAEFYEGIQNAESHLSEFNDELFASSEEQQNLEKNMQEIQNGITTICKTASDERRGYTEEEILQLDEYFQKLSDLADQQLQIQEEKAKAIQQQAVTQSQAFTGSLEEYKTIGQEWLKTAQEQRDQQISIIQEQTTTQLALLNKEFGDEAVLSNAAYKEKYDELMRRKEESIQIANDEVSAVGNAYQNGYLERAEDLNNWLINATLMARHEEELQAAHNEKIATIENAKSEALHKIYSDRTLTLAEQSDKAQTISNYFNSQRSKEDSEFIEESKRLQEQFRKGLDESTMEQLGAWLTMLSQTEMYGGDISEADKKMIDGILDEYDRLPPEAQEAMKNAMTPMLDEMEKAEPSLFEKASSIAGGILNRLKITFDEHSPSKKTREIFQNVMKGAELGIDKEKNNLMKSVQDVADDTLKQFEAMDTDSMISKMQATVSANSSRVGTAYAAFGNYQASKNGQGGSGDSFGSTTTNNQYITFEQPMQAPDEIARALRIQQTFGLAGAR